MKYYKVIKGDVYDRKTGYCTIPGELVTERERSKHFPNLSNDVFELVNVSKSKVYFCFGARFESKDT